MSSQPPPFSSQQQQQHQTPPQAPASSSASSASAPQHGRHFLSDLTSAAPKQQPQQPPAGRPIRGGGGAGGGFPDVAAHEWNVNVADFVPTPPAPHAPSAAGPHSAGGGSSGDDSPTQLANQSLARLRSAADREQSEAAMAAALAGLRRGARTRDDPARLVVAIVRLACADRGLCEPAAGLLAYLALNFTVSDKESPHLMPEQPGPLARLPMYLALMRHCSEENDRLCRALAVQKTASDEQAAYVLLFCLIYACLPSPSAPAERQPAVAKAALRLLGQLADLANCPAAFRGVHAALLAVGELLDADAVAAAAAAASTANGDDGDVARQLDGLYERLRQAVAHCRVGDVALATDIIRLLELRASGWGRPPPGFALSSGLSTASADSVSQSMSDDMYADYEQFLRESGQM